MIARHSLCITRYFMITSSMKKNKLFRIVALNAVCIFAAVSVFASEIDIKGRIVGESRQAIEFANIVLQTPDSVFVSGTTTGEDGRFALPKVRTGDYRLIVSIIGYETQAIDLKGYSGNLQLNDIVLAECVQDLSSWLHL